MEAPPQPFAPSPPRRGHPGSAPPPALVGCQPDLTLPSATELRGCETPSGANARGTRRCVTSLGLHWHTVVEWQADVVLTSESGLGEVAQQVMRAKAGASGRQLLWGAPLESGREGGAFAMHWPGGGVSWFATAFPDDQSSRPKGRPGSRRTSLARTLWHSTRYCHDLVGLGRGADSLHAQVAYGVSSLPLPSRVFWDQATLYVARQGTAPQLVGGGEFNFDLNYPLQAPPSILASLLTRRLVGAHLELACALGRDPLCSYQSPEGTRPSRIDGLLVDTRLALWLRAAEHVPCGATLGCTPVRFHQQLKGSSQ